MFVYELKIVYGFSITREIIPNILIAEIKIDHLEASESKWVNPNNINMELTHLDLEASILFICLYNVNEDVEFTKNFIIIAFIKILLLE